MKPEWNIHFTIVEPGGFATDWAGRSMVHAKTPEPYLGGAADYVRKMVAAMEPEGDPNKAAAAMIRIAYESKPPLKLPLGKDCVGIIRSKLNEISKELNEWEALSTSTSRDSYTPLTSEDLVAVLGK